MKFNKAKTTTCVVPWAAKACERGKKVALLTLVDVDGSAPFPIGTQMAVADDGSFFGRITGGCAEASLVELAMQDIQQGCNRLERFGAGSRFFDIQLPCGSGIDVYFDARLGVHEFSRLANAQKRRDRLYLNFDLSVEVDSHWSITPREGQGDFVRPYDPQPRLVVLGQGPILSRLAMMTVDAGFDTLIVSTDEVASASLIEEGLAVMTLEEFHADFEYADLDPKTAVVTLFHDHDVELPILEKVVATDAGYIGALGSPRTAEQRRQQLLDRGVESRQIERIFGPVGIDLGAKSPSAVAVSILAQFIQQIHQ